MGDKTGRKSPVQKSKSKEGNPKYELMPRSPTGFYGLSSLFGVKPYYNREFEDRNISKSPVLGRIDNNSRSARLQSDDENMGEVSHTMNTVKPSPIMASPTFYSSIFPLPFRPFGSGGYSYPGIGAEEEGYTDQEFYENVNIAIDGIDDTFMYVATSNLIIRNCLFKNFKGLILKNFYA